MNDTANIPNNPYHFLGVVNVIYMREDAPKQRTVNVLVNVDNPNLSKQTLQGINEAAVRRVAIENGVTAEDIRDVVILNIVLLGCMPDDVFHQMPPVESAISTEAGTEPSLDADSPLPA